MVGPTRFCMRCGRELSEGQHVCPQCGYGDGHASPDARVRVVDSGSVRLNWAVVLLLVYGLISLAEGILVAFFAEGLVEYIEMMTKVQIQDLFGEGMTRGEVIRMLTVEGYITMLSGLFASLAGYCCFRRRNLTFALAGTLSAAVILMSEPLFVHIDSLFMILVQFLIGIFVFRMILLSKNLFTD